MSLDPKVRSAVYTSGTAVIAVLVAYGVVTQEQAGVWTNLAAGVVGLLSSGVAFVHRPTKTPPSK